MVQLQHQARDWGLELHRSQLKLLEAYADSLATYSLANVIGTKDRGRIVSEHLADSLSCCLIDELGDPGTLIDVGAGAGLPGIPLKIARPHLQVALVESVSKKARFMQQVRNQLGLHDLEVLLARVEEVARQPTRRETFQVAVARALAELAVVAEYCAPLVRVGGAVVAMKGAFSESEMARGLAASKAVGLALREVRKVPYRSDFTQKERHLVVLRKVRPTPQTFPRKLGVAKKRPLGHNRT
jgi:16S rRNA (guanine527-N7)-methyltransferase